MYDFELTIRVYKNLIAVQTHQRLQFTQSICAGLKYAPQFIFFEVFILFLSSWNLFFECYLWILKNGVNFIRSRTETTKNIALYSNRTNYVFLWSCFHKILQFFLFTLVLFLAAKCIIFEEIVILCFPV